MATLTGQRIDRLAEFWRALPHLYAQVCSGGRWVCYSYLRLLSRIVFQAVTRGGARIIVNTPPRHGKSEFCSFWVPAWFLDASPDRRIMVVSYGDDLARGFGRRVRDEFQANPLCRARLREDVSAAGRWETPEGGGMVCTGIGGALTGRGFDLGIVDDPVKSWADAHSRVHQRRLQEWFGGTFLTRAEPGASIIIVMQRWTDDDLVGWLVGEHPEEWTVVRLPAEAEPGDLLERAKGQALCPERYDGDELAAKRREVGRDVWNACYQQAPDEARTGRVFSNFSDRNLRKDLTLRHDLPLDVSLDPGARSHIGCVVGQHDERADMLHAVHEIRGPGVRCSRDAAEAFCRFVAQAGGWKWPRLRLFGDPTAHDPGRSTATYEADWTVFRQVVRQRFPAIQLGIRTPRRTIPVADSVTTFNECLCDVENVVHYLVHPRCERLVRDLRGLRLADDGGIDKAADPEMGHCADAERYRVWCCRRLRIDGADDRHVGRMLVG